MITKNVIMNMKTSFNITRILKMMGPKCLETIPVFMLFKMASVKAMPQNILPVASTAAMFTIGSSRTYSSIRIMSPTKKKKLVRML